MNHHTSKGFAFHKDVFLHHPPWNLYQLSTIFCQGLSVSHLPCRIVPNSTAGGNEPVPLNHLCSQTIPSANCMRLPTVIQVSHLWKERSKEGELDKKRLDCSIVPRKARQVQWAVLGRKVPGGEVPQHLELPVKYAPPKQICEMHFHGLHITLTSVCPNHSTKAMFEEVT